MEMVVTITIPVPVIVGKVSTMPVWAAIEVASGHATHVAVATTHMTHVAHSAAASAAVVATHSTAAKVKPASATAATHGLATTPTAATHGLATTATAGFHQLDQAEVLFRSKVGSALAGSCVAASKATPLARAVIVIAYRIGSSFLQSLCRPRCNSREPHAL
jgi:hypothetical protein